MLHTPLEGEGHRHSFKPEDTQWTEGPLGRVANCIFIKDVLIQLSSVQQPLNNSSVCAIPTDRTISSCRRDHFNIVAFGCLIISSLSSLHSTFQDCESNPAGRKLPAHFLFLLFYIIHWRFMVPSAIGSYEQSLMSNQDEWQVSVVWVTFESSQWTAHNAMSHPSTEVFV